MSYKKQKPFYCNICDSGFLSHIKLVYHDCEETNE